MTKGSSSSWLRVVLACCIGLSIAADATATQFCDACTPNVIDITHAIVLNSAPAPPEIMFPFFFPLVYENPGIMMITGNFTLGTHTGTHVLSLAGKCPSSSTSDALNLLTLTGPVLVIDTPRDSNITAQVLQSLNLPVGLKRIIFRTKNTDRALMDEKNFLTDYTGLTADGAEWLVRNSSIKFVGIDYLSLARYDEIEQVREILFGGCGNIGDSIIPVEGLVLGDAQVKPGSTYTVYCLPLRAETEASPSRCILVE